MRIVNDHVRLQVPATSANLGPGFDTFGVALDLVDDIDAYAIAGSSEITIEGHGKDTLPRDDSHLIVRALHYALDVVEAPRFGVQMRCINRIPHGRGLGSSAAAIVAGILLARGFIDKPETLNNEKVLELATHMEGHGDNVAPAIYGGATLVWTNSSDILDCAAVNAVQLPCSALKKVTVCIPHMELATTKARSVLPAEVSLEAAVFNVSRAGLLVHAINHDPALLYDATKDRLHQDYRYEAMPDSLQLVDYLREHQLPAVISGAGPSVMVMEEIPIDMQRAMSDAGWDVRVLGINHDGANIKL